MGAGFAGIHEQCASTPTLSDFVRHSRTSHFAGIFCQTRVSILNARGETRTDSRRAARGDPRRRLSARITRRGQHRQPARELEDNPQRWVDRTDVIAMQPGDEAQLLLAQAAPRSGLTHRTTERPVLPSPRVPSSPHVCLLGSRAPRSTHATTSVASRPPNRAAVSPHRRRNPSVPGPGALQRRPGHICHWRRRTRPEPAIDLKSEVAASRQGTLGVAIEPDHHGDAACLGAVVAEC